MLGVSGREKHATKIPSNTQIRWVGSKVVRKCLPSIQHTQMRTMTIQRNTIKTSWFAATNNHVHHKQYHKMIEFRGVSHLYGPRLLKRTEYCRVPFFLRLELKLDWDLVKFLCSRVSAVLFCNAVYAIRSSRLILVFLFYRVGKLGRVQHAAIVVLAALRSAHSRLRLLVFRFSR